MYCIKECYDFQLTIEEKTQMIEDLLRDVKIWRKIVRKGRKTFGLFSEDSKYYESIDNILDNYIISVEKAVGDKEGWLMYYMFDMNFGKTPRYIRNSILDGCYKVLTANDLMAIINDSTKYTREGNQ